MDIFYSYIGDNYIDESGIVPDTDIGNDIYCELIENKKKLIDEIDVKMKENKDLMTKSSEPVKKSLQAMNDKLYKEKERHQAFGYEHIKYRDKYPYLEDLKVELNERFIGKYGHMRIAFNTAERFQLKLQTKFDDIAPFYENQLRLLKLYEDQILDDKRRIKKISVNDENTSETSNTDNGGPPSMPITSSSIKSISTAVKNIASGYEIYQDVLRKYLKEFRYLFLRVWPDMT